MQFPYFGGRDWRTDLYKLFTSQILKMRFLLIIICPFIVFTGFGQSDTAAVKKKNYSSISANYSYGNVMRTNDFVKGENLEGKTIDHFQSMTLKALWQNPGYTDWQKVYRGPYYGIGLSVGKFSEPKEIGTPLSIYGILGIPIKRWKKLELYTEFQFGIAGNWKQYDYINNPKNLVIGSGITLHVDLGINAFYPITKNIDLGAGMNFTHFSNGGIKLPNLGFNLCTASLELKYHLSGRPNVRSIPAPGRLRRSNDLYFMIGYSLHQFHRYETNPVYYAVAGISAIYSPQLSNAFRLGVGTDINYWGGLTTPPPEKTNSNLYSKNLTTGIILQPEIIVGKLTLVGGVGIYAYHPKFGNFKKTYNRLGVRYEFYRNFSIGVNVRAIDFSVAQFLEFNLGYRIRWMK